MNRLVSALLALAVAAGQLPSAGASEPTQRVSSAPTRKGRPVVTLDQLDLSAAPRALSEEKLLRDLLAREVRRADWGVGRGARIQYRFRIDELSVIVEAGVVSVRCSATGWLPKGRSARSHLTFGGAPDQEPSLVRHVLEIVARGVVTRLADIERRRRAA